MTKDQQKIIRGAVEANREIIKRLQLQNQALMAQLPEPVKTMRRADNGFINLPGGEKLVYNDKLYKKYEAGRQGVIVMTGGKRCLSR